MKRVIRFGSRKSALAVAQTRILMDAVAAAHPEATITHGSHKPSEMADALTQESTIAYAMKDRFNCTFPIYAPDYLTAAFAVAYPATIKWDATQGMKVIFGKTASGLTPTVTTCPQSMPRGRRANPSRTSSHVTRMIPSGFPRTAPR